MDNAEVDVSIEGGKDASVEVPIEVENANVEVPIEDVEDEDAEAPLELVYDTDVN